MKLKMFKTSKKYKESRIRMSRTIYGICVNDIDINQRKLLNLMKETLPDFPSDGKFCIR